MELDKRLKSTISFKNMGEKDKRIGVWGKFNMGTKESENFNNKTIRELFRERGGDMKAMLERRPWSGLEIAIWIME